MYLDKIATMNNMIEAQKNPAAFAKRVLQEYRNGAIPGRLNAQKAELLKRYKADEIRDSGWKYLMSSGQYKYEARYDLITPVDSYYFVWQINLRDKTIIPLNKLSERLMQ